MSRLLIILTLMALLTACSSNSRSKREKGNEQAIGTQQILAESGFVQSMLDTPEKFADARELPQRQVIAQGTGNTGRYVYVDTSLCGCMYSGDASAYERYQRRIEQQTTRSNNYQVEQIQSGNRNVIRPIGRAPD